MEVILLGLSHLALILVSITPVIFIFSISLLGRSLRQAKEEKEKEATKTKKEIDAEYEEMNKKLEAMDKARDDPSKIAEVRKSIESIVERQTKSAQEQKRTTQKYGVLTLRRSLVEPSIAFLVALVLVWITQCCYNDLDMPSPDKTAIILCILVLVVYSISRGIYNIYRIAWVIAKIARPTEDITFKSTVEAFQEALDKHEKSKKPILTLRFKTPTPFKISKSSTETLSFGIGMKQADFATAAELWVFAPPGFEYPEANSWSQDPDFAIPNALTIIDKIDETLLAGTAYWRHVKIKAPAQEGEYTLAYSLKCQGFSLEQERFKVIVH